MTKAKHLSKVKLNLKMLFSAFCFVTFLNGDILRQKAIRALEIAQIVETQTLNDEHIYLTMV